MIPHYTGQLFDLAPDGLAFIALESPAQTFAFHLKQLGLCTFEEAGLREGMRVRFHLNSRRQVDSVTPLGIAQAPEPNHTS